MLTQQARDAYSQLTPGERLALTLQTMSDSLPHLRVGPPEVVDLRLELIRRENAASQRAHSAQEGVTPEGACALRPGRSAETIPELT